MILIKHRVNSINDLIGTEKIYGVEIDVRTFNNKLILSHDPFQNGCFLVDWLENFKHKFLIINVKEDGLEGEILDLLDRFKIRNFFFLDQPFPTIINLVKNNLFISALRISEFENVNLYAFKDKLEWIWLDSFNNFNLEDIHWDEFRRLNFKICLVSPELQGRESSEIILIKDFLMLNKILIDAVCTKKPELWISI